MLETRDVGKWPAAVSVSPRHPWGAVTWWLEEKGGARGRSLVRFLILLLLSIGVGMAIGLGAGFLLHRFVPAIDVGMGTLIGVVTLGGCFLWLSRISTLEALLRQQRHRMV